jgi:hypothetical protein
VSDLAKKLEALAISKGIDGFVGLLDIAPYEFAWYGEFVYTKYPHLFIPRDPVIMTFCHLESHARDFLDGRFEVGRDQWGILFQPPTTNIIAPEVAYEVLNGAKPMSEMKEIFENYALKNLWKDSESKSGPGSTLAATLNLREQLSVLVREQPAIRVFFDAPCGDFNWMRAVDFPSDLKYIGGEIAPALVDQNRSKYQSESRDFIEFDITESDFPVVADIWFCRDCLFHLPNVYILKALRNFYKSGIPRFMTSTHLNTGDFVNTDIPMAGFRLLDLYGEPFCFPRHVYFQVADYVFPYARREMSMWLREQVGEVISHLEKAIPGQ